MASEPAPAYAVETYTDPDGRPFGYVHLRHPGADGLAVHFSAFFGKWGDARPYRDTFQGYFHRLKMLGQSPAHDWLFLCDSYGAFDNGCYYAGEKGDLFVERAMLHLLDDHVERFGYRPDRMVLAGSSMGATAALKFGLQRDVRGIVAIGPHVDLDISAATQNRMAEVAWICPDGDVAAVANHVYTRQIHALVEATAADGRRLPRLFVQSCEDDAGVHAEQVLPLVDRWRAVGGDAVLDARPHGGHTSDWATGPLLLDVIGRLMRGDAVDPARYQTDPAFAGAPTEPPLSHRVRRRLSLARKRVLRRS